MKKELARFMAKEGTIYIGLRSKKVRMSTNRRKTIKEVTRPKVNITLKISYMHKLLTNVQELQMVQKSLSFGYSSP